MTLQAVTHASDSPLTLDRLVGDDADVSMFADVTSLAFTNIGDGEVIRAKFKAFSGARVVNLTGFQVINGYTNPGAVTVPNGGTYVVVAFGAFGGVYLSLGFAEAPPTVAGVAQILPAGGDAGQLLGKVTDTDYDYGLVDPPAGGGSGLPTGGTTGQVLSKTTNTDGDADWSTLPAVNEVPAGGTTDQVLTKLASGYDWADAGGSSPVLSYSLPASLTAAVGRRTFDGVFPGPTGAGITRNVATPTDFDQALLNGDPGDVIVLADGVWDLSSGVSWSLGQEGTAENPIIIRPATVDGVTLTMGDDLVVNGAHVHFWNINIDGGTGTGSVVRFFQPHCKWLHASVTNNTTYANVFKVEDGHYLELADLTLTNVEGIELAMSMSNNGGGGTRAKHCHAHHWTVDNTGATTPGEMIQTGQGNLTATPKLAADDDYTHLLVEYMDINWHVSGDSEIISGKSSGDTYRYNYVRSNGGGGHLSVRDGSDSLVYGNWIEDTSLAFRFNGERNLGAYNVVKERAAGTTALQLHLTNTFGDRGSYDNRLTRNVFDGDFTTFVKTTANGQTIAADPNPKGNSLFGNWWDGAGGPTSYNLEAGHTQADLEAENTISTDWLFDGAGNPEAPIPVALGVLEGSPTLGHEPGQFLTVPQPFWWADAVAVTEGDTISYPPADTTTPTGDVAFKTSGPTPDRPTFPTGFDSVGFQYLDTDLNAGAGMLIVWNGTNWINPSTGATV